MQPLADYRSYVPTAENEVVVDLKNLIQPLMDYQDVSHLLSQEQEDRLVQFVRALMKMSHSRISKRYSHWQEADRAHDVWVPPEATRFREKAVISDTRAIADTVLTYMMAALFGRNPMFMLEGMDRKSRKVSAIMERLLHQHGRRTALEARLAQLLLDSIRYGFAPTKIVWDSLGKTNRFVNFDPRRCFPDPRVQWGNWERMQFCIFSDFCSTSALQSSKMYPKLAMYPGLRQRRIAASYSWEGHQWMKEEGKGLNINPTAPIETQSNYMFSLDPARTVDECWVRLNGYEIGVPAIDQIWLVVTILDEEVCLRLQLCPYGQQFPTLFGGLYFDAHKTFSQSLYDLLLPLHDIATWMLRSRIDNVQAALNNLIFVDPTQVSVTDLINRNPWGVVRTLPGAKPGDGVFIAQVPDVTSGHWNDIQAMSELKQRTSAASDAQQGMPTADGIRTATEIQRLSQMGSQRLGVLSRILSATTVRPGVRMMVTNIQDALDFNGSIKIDPAQQTGVLAPMIQDGYLDFSIADLQGDIDYMVVDGTLPVEPTRNAETWINILQVLNQTGLAMEYKAGMMVEEAIKAMGLSDLDQFRISPQERQQQGLSPSQQMMMMEKMRGASVQPNEQIQREAEKGNLIPMSQAQKE